VAKASNVTLAQVWHSTPGPAHLCTGTPIARAASCSSFRRFGNPDARMSHRVRLRDCQPASRVEAWNPTLGQVCNSVWRSVQRNAGNNRQEQPHRRATACTLERGHPLRASELLSRRDGFPTLWNLTGPTSWVRSPGFSRFEPLSATAEPNRLKLGLRTRINQIPRLQEFWSSVAPRFGLARNNRRAYSGAHESGMRLGAGDCDCVAGWS